MKLLKELLKQEIWQSMHLKSRYQRKEIVIVVLFVLIILKMENVLLIVLNVVKDLSDEE